MTSHLKLTFKDDLDMSPLYKCFSFRITCMQNMKFLSVIVWKLLIFTHIFDLWPLMMTLTFYICGYMGYIYIPNMKSLSSLVQKLKGMLNLLILNLRMTLTLTIHPLKICIFMRYICKPNMKYLSVMAQKLRPYVVKSVIWPICIFDPSYDVVPSCGKQAATDVTSPV